MKPTRDQVFDALVHDAFRAVYGELGSRRSANPAGWVSCRCPFHEDRRPSFAFNVRTGRWKCLAGCGQGDAFDFHARTHGHAGFRETLAALASAMGIAASSQERRDIPPFRPEDARRVWERSCAETAAAVAARPAGLERTAAALAVHRARAFLERRGLEGALDGGACGVLTPAAAALHPALERWPESEHILIAPLHAVADGELVSLQARSVAADPRGSKTLFPRGARASGTVFANPPGLEALRAAEARGPSPAILAEGLTDFLAFSLAARTAVLAVPGVGVAVSAVSAWARARRVYIAFDNDDAGESQVLATARAVEAQGGEPFRVSWPEGLKDACDALAAAGRAGLRSWIEMHVERGSARESARGSGPGREPGRERKAR